MREGYSSRGGAEKDSIRVAIVGHTNAGKTSLIRTLLRSSDFGEVNVRPGTTRHVEEAAIVVDGDPVIRLYDTPGLEDSIGLYQMISSLEGPDGRAKLERFLKELPDGSEFDQEAKVIRQLLRDDLIFYVIDCREPVLGKYRDEISVIAMAARPIIPVLNFTGSNPVTEERWTRELADLRLHALVRFDTVVFNFGDEKILYQKMQALLSAEQERLQRLIDARERQWQSLREAGAEVIANVVVNAGAFRQYQTQVQADQATDTSGLPDARSGAVILREQVRNLERQGIRQLLQLFDFTKNDIKSDELPVRNGEWELDLFDPVTLRQLGLDAGSNAAKGAAVGVGIDAMAGGMTLGAAAALGAAAGVVWTAGRRYRDEIKARLRGGAFICVDEVTLHVLWSRLLILYQALQHRGHASQTSIVLHADKASETDDPNSKAMKLPDQWRQWLKTMRAHPEWSSLNRSADHSSAEPQRTELINAIRQNLLDRL